MHELYRQKEGKPSLQGVCVYSRGLSQDSEVAKSSQDSEAAESYSHKFSQESSCSQELFQDSEAPESPVDIKPSNHVQSYDEDNDEDNEEFCDELVEEMEWSSSQQ